MKNNILLFRILKTKFLLLVFSCFILFPTKSIAEDSTLKIQYIFDSVVNGKVIDNTGNANDATLNNGATLKKIGRYDVLDLGSQNGYLDMGAKTGQIIQTLSDFSIALFVYVDPAKNITAAGNFVWTFANSTNMSSTANGNMFYRTGENRYAIAKTNFKTERTIKQGAALTKGSWQHITYTQAGNTGTIYLNGVKVKSDTLSVYPSVLGATTSNFLGRSCYSADAYLTKSMINDFRLYNRALSDPEVVSLSSQKAGLDSALFIQQLAEAKSRILLNGLDSVKFNLTLPTNGGNGILISWNSSNTSVISNLGVVTRPAVGASSAVVHLTATISKGGITETKEFFATVFSYYSDKMAVVSDSTSLRLYGNLNSLVSNLSLRTNGDEGSVIAWSSSEPTVLSANGTILSRPAKGAGKTKVTLTATITKRNETTTKTFDVYIAEPIEYTTYLWAYFNGTGTNQEALRFALSNDGYNYKSLNNNNPVLNSATISTSGGVRDPHILRGENNDYFIVTTDFISPSGWVSNSSMDLIKSTNLTDWTSSVVNIPNTYPEYSAADRIWAPQTIYDPTVGKYMIYFAMRLGASDYDKIYYAYANSTFTALESSPKVLFDNSGKSTIDADIILKDGVYNLFFKTEGNGNGIKRATSSHLTSGYVMIDKYLQCTTAAVEGSCVFKMINSDNYILMYDLYSNGKYEFTTSTDLSNFTVVSPAPTYDFAPRHGTIMTITAAEKQALNAKWGTTETPSLKNNSTVYIYPNPVKETLNVVIDKSIDSDMEISVFDLMGNKNIRTDVKQRNVPLNVSNLKPGTYLLKCMKKNIEFSHLKFIKE